MEQRGLDKITALAELRSQFFNNKLQYFVYAMLAGVFCTLGMAFSYSAGAGFYNSELLNGAYKLIMGLSFSLALTLIIFAGSELFTGNVLVMSVGILNKVITLNRGISLLSFCYFANLAGAVLMGLVFSGTGLLTGQAGDLLISSCAAKMALPFGQALFRGIICNILLCLGIWINGKLQSETAKMIIIAWVITGFVTPGYEHSIANAGLFTMAFMTGQADGVVSPAGVLFNMIPVTIGNIIGGSVFVGLAYWYSGRENSFVC